jgi:hypothetical protein
MRSLLLVFLATYFEDLQTKGSEFRARRKQRKIRNYSVLSKMLIDIQTS